MMGTQSRVVLIALLLMTLLIIYLPQILSFKTSIVITESNIQDLRKDLSTVKPITSSLLEEQSLILFARAHLLAFSYSHKMSSDKVTVEDMHGKNIIIVGMEFLSSAFQVRLAMINEQRRSNNQTIIIPASVNRYQHLFQDCLFGDPVDNYDVFLVSSWDFYTEVVMKMMESVAPPALYPWEDYLFYEDFAVPIVVDYVKMEKESLKKLNKSDIEPKVDENFKYYFDQIYSNGNYSLEMPQSVAKGVVYLVYKCGFGNITTDQQVFLKRFMNSSANLIDFYPNFNSSRYVAGYKRLASYFNGTNWIQKTRVEFSEIFCYSQISLQYFVCSEVHLLMSAAAFDGMNIAAMGFGVFYFVCLFTVCHKKALKRRLIVPYVLPILAMVSAIFFSYFADMMCTTLKMGCLACFIGGMIGVYSFVIIRFSYLRHLYIFLENASKRKIKFHKFMASTAFGIIGSILSGIVCALVWLAVVIPIIATSKGNSIRTITNIIIMAEVFSGCIIGFFVISVDVIVNWKKIRERGIISFFTFEDPFYLRWDMISFFSIFISLAVIIVLFSTSSSTQMHYYDIISGLFHMIALISVYFLSGFTAIIFEWKKLFTKCYSRKSLQEAKKQNDEESLLEIYLKDPAFLQLFKIYCAKEFSLENVLLYEELETIRAECEYENKPNMNMKTFDQIYNTFFKKYSKYEINLPSRVYKEVDYLYEQSTMNGEEICFRAFSDLIKTDLIINLNDTFERLKETKQFKRWNMMRRIQEKQSIV